MKRVLIFFSIVLLLLGAVAVTIPFLLNPDFIGEQLQAAVKRSTGRTLTLARTPRLSFWPELAVEIDGASLSNPPGMFAGQVAKMDQLRVRVDAMSLLSKRLVVKEVTLLRPDLRLIVDGKGQANWVFATASADASAGTSSQGTTATEMIDSISIAPVVIEDGRLRYLDERTGTVFAASNVNMSVSMPDLNSPLTAKGSLVWNTEKVALNIYVKTPVALAERGSPLDLALNARLLELTFNGRAAMTNGLSMAGTVDLKTQSLRGLAKWSGNPLAPGKGLEAFYARGALDLSGQTIKLSKAKLGLDGMNAQGGVTVSLAGKRPHVTANLGVDRIDTNIYAAPANRPQGAINTGWSDAPIDMSGLKAIDANLNLAAASIRYGDVNIGRTNVAATLTSGVLKTDLKEMTFYDGKATGKLVIDGSRKKPALQGALNATGMDAYRLLADFAKLKRISGVSGMQLSVAASGSSQHEMVSTLRGTSKLQFTNGALRGLNLARMIRNVESAILGGWDVGPEQQTDFSLLEASFNIKDGIAENKDLKLLGPLVRITGLGEVDLLRQALDYRTTPKLVASLKGQGGKADLKGLAVPIIIKGPWANPKIYPDIEGILRDPEAAFKALAKLGKLGTDVDLEQEAEKLKEKAKKIEKKVLKKVEKQVVKEAEKVLGEEAAQVLGDEVSKSLGEGGKSLLNNLLGGGTKEPAPEPQAIVPQQGEAVQE
jgi:AsmA protein